MKKLPSLLMISSLLLLLVFLGFWLQSEYTAEQEDMKEEVNFMFMNDIREIEDQYFKQLLDPLESGKLDSFTTQTIDKIRILSTKSEVTNFTLVEGEDRQSPPSDTSMKVVIRSHFNDEDKRQLDGSISMWVTLDDDGSSDSINIFHRDSLETFTLIKEHFAKSAEIAELNLEYNILETKSDSMPIGEMVTSRYYDTFSHKSYVLQVENFRKILLKRILPQILFSAFLFSSIVFAFYVVYQNMEKQKRLTLLKNDFISNVTHELKTPIATVAVAIEALRNFDALKDPERTQEYLSISQNELNRLTILVDKVLKMSMFEQKEPELKLEWINLKELTQEILNTMKLQFDKFAAQVDFQSTGDRFNLKGDRIHLTSVLYNLLDNALKYSIDYPKINIAIRSLETSVELTVRDKGIGISNEYKDRIFEKFFRIPTGDEHNIKGYGLGLSYVGEVVKKHEGTINLTSDEGKGSCFTITLPFEG